MRSESRFKGIRLIMLTVICFAALLASVLLGVFLTRPAPTTASAAEGEPTSITLTLKEGATVYNLMSLDDVKSCLTLTGTYADGQEAEITDYELSASPSLDENGKLTAGSVTLTATYTPEDGEPLTGGLEVTVTDASTVKITDIDVSLREGIAVTATTLHPGENLPTETQHADLPERLLVKLYDESSNFIGTALPSEISVSGGNFAIGETMFTVKYGTISEEFTTIVEQRSVVAISAQFNAGEATVYSYTDTTDAKQYFTVYGSYNDGTTASLSGNEFSIMDNFSAPQGYNGTDSTFDKYITVGYISSDNTITCECFVSGITAGTPSAINIQKNTNYVIALEPFKASDITVTVMYDGGTYSAVTTNYTVEYVDKDGDKINGATGYQRDENGTGYIKVTYIENGQTFTRLVSMTVNQVSHSQVYFGSGNVYKYTVDDNGNVTSVEQLIEIAGGYDKEIMQITSATDSKTNPIDFNSDAGSITVFEAGTYYVTVMLTNPAYYWQGTENATSITIECEVNKAELSNLEAKFVLEDGTSPENNSWAYSTPVDIVVTGNYGEGEVTYYLSKNGGAEAKVDELPSDNGTYGMKIEVAETDNFKGGSYNLGSFTIGQRKIAAPSADPLTYNGSEQDPSINYAVAGTDTYPSDSKYLTYTIKNHEGKTVKNAGDYTLEFSIKDEYRSQVIWANGVDSDGNGKVEVPFTVNKLEIAKPTLNTISSTYNGLAQEFSFSSYNATDSSGSFTAIKASVSYSGENTSVGSVTVSEDGKFSLTYAGTYTITLSLNDNDIANLKWKDGDSTGQLTYTFTMNKAGVEVPDAGSKTYTGGTLTSDLTDVSSAGGYTVTTNNGGIDVGSYDVVLTLNDPANYKWNEKEGATIAGANVTIEFDITQATNQWTTTLDISALTDWTYGDDEPSPTAEAKFGDVSFEYAAADSDNYSTTVPTAAGRYRVRAVVNGTNNYTGLTSYVREFSIAKRTVSVTISEKSDETYTYDGTSKAVTWNYTNDTSLVSGDGTSIQITYTGTPNGSEGQYNSTNAPTNAGNYTATASISGDASGNYTLEGSSFSFTIDRATLTKPGWRDSDTYTYSSKPQIRSLDANYDSDKIKIDSATGANGKRITFTDDGAFTATDADIYTVTLSLADPNNYKWSDSTAENDNILSFTLTWQIGEDDNTLSVSVKGITYGETPAPEASNIKYGDSDDVTYTYYYKAFGSDVGYESAGSTPEFNAGYYYVVATIEATDNYHKVTYGSETTTAFTISRAEVDRTEPAISGSYTYNGTPHTVALMDSSDKYFVTESTRTQTDAGIHGITVELSYNYKWNGEDDESSERTVTLEWTIARYTVTAPSITRETEYQNGTEIKPNLPGTITDPNVTGDIAYSISYSNADSAEYGEYSVTLTFTDTVNFTWQSNSANQSANVTGDSISDNGQSITLYYRITRQLYDMTYEVKNGGWIYGDTPSSVVPAAGSTLPDAVQQALNSGTATITYTYTLQAESGEGATYSDPKDLPAGNYTVSVNIPQIGSYEARTFTADFTITARDITASVKNSEFTYNGIDYFATATTDKTADVYNANSNNVKWAYSFTENKDDISSYASSVELKNVKYSDGSVVAYTVYYVVTADNHNPAFGSFTVTIKPMEIKIIWSENASAAAGEEYHFGYNGTDQKRSVTASYMPAQADSTAAITLNVVLPDGVTEFKNYRDGGYAFTASFAAGDNTLGNYVLPETVTNTYYIDKAPVTVMINSMSETYTGNPFKTVDGVKDTNYTVTIGTVYSGDDLDITITINSEDGATNVGTYNVSASYANANYDVTFDSSSFTDAFNITAANITITTTDKTGNAALTYSAVSQFVAAISGNTAITVGNVKADWQYNLDDGETYYDSVELINAGEYTVYYVVTADNHDPETGSFKVKINSYTVTINWADDNFTYNGEDQQSRVTAAYTTLAADGEKQIPLAVTLTGNEFKNYNNGVGYTFTAAFDNNYSETNKNYALPEVVTAEFHIKQLAVSVTLDSGSISYGDELPTFSWKYTDGSNRFVDNITEGAAIYNITAAVDTKVIEGATYVVSSANSYNVTATAADSWSDILANYDVTVANGKLTVSARAISVTIDEASATSVYGNAESTIGYTIGGNGLYVGDNASEVFSVSAGVTNTSSAGDYDVTLTNKKGASYYTITLKNDGASELTIADLYKVTPAEITSASISDKADYVYNGLNRFDAAAADRTVSLVNHEANVSSVKWQYNLDDGETYYDSVELINAGEYTVYYVVTADNHNPKTGSFKVIISKARLTVTVTAETTYGDDDSGIEYIMSAIGLQNGETAEAAGLVLGKTFTVSHSYSTGDDAGIYLITLNDKTNGEGLENYTITYAHGALSGDEYTGSLLTVNKRAITVTINDAGSTYGADIAELKYSLYPVDGAIYGDDKPFTLVTNATNTSDVGSYFIYATKVDTTNYDITFNGSTIYTADVNEAANDVAGVYTISAAEANINISANTRKYNGLAFEATATVTDDSGLSSSDLTPVYYKDSVAEENILTSAPVDVGHYYVVFRSTNPNYTTTSVSVEFYINVREITVTITAKDGVYNNVQYGASVEFSGLPDVEGDRPAAEREAFTNGNAYTITYTGTSYNSTDAPKNAGSYTATVTLNANYLGNYTISSENTKEFEITPREILIPINNATVIYGNELPELSVDKDAETIEFADGEDYDALGITKINYTTALNGSGDSYSLGADAGSVFTITATAEYTNGNYDVKFSSATLTVNQREITVTINDQSLTYTGEAAALDQNEYTISGNGGVFGNDNLGITLSSGGVNGSVNVGTYAITASASGTDAHNYSITYSGNWAGEDENKGAAGILTINKKGLKVTANPVSVRYGDDAEFTVSYDGFVHGEDEETYDLLGGTLTFSTTLSSGTDQGTAGYDPGDPAGNTYTITPSGLTADNYNIEFESGILTVTKRIVTVTVEVPGDKQYNYDNALPAKVTFSDYYGTDAVGHEVYYRGTSYSGTTLGSDGNAWVTIEPILAGDYYAKVLITDSNYTFSVAGADGAPAAESEYSEEFAYIVAKRTIDVNWIDMTLQVNESAQEYTNSLRATGLWNNAAFDSDILNVTSLYTNTPGVKINGAAGADDSSYTATVTSSGADFVNFLGYYTAVITINSEYQYNYTFGGSEGNTSTISFQITAEENKIIITIEGDEQEQAEALAAVLSWTYGDPGDWSVNGSALTQYISLTAGGELSDLQFAYAERTDGSTAESAAYSPIRPDKAGNYYVRIYYPGDPAQGYSSAAFFYSELTIYKASLDAPTLAAGETTYNGSEQSKKVVGFDAALMGITTSVSVTADGNDITLYATNKGEYTVTISLKQPENYEWNTGGGSNPIKLTWTINMATDNLVTFVLYSESWTYGESQAGFTASSTYGTPVVRYAAYDGDAPSGELTQEQIHELSALSWSPSLPVNAGRYLAVAYVRDTNENYNDAYAFMIFKVNKADLTVIVTGYSGTYDGASHNAVSSSLVTGANGVVIASPAWTYSLTSDGEYTSGMPQFKDVADSGSYTVYYKVTAGNNYNEASGSFTVTIEKKDLTLRVENAEITYGEAAPSVFGLASAGWVPGEGITDTKDLTPTITDADGKPYAAGSPVGSYTVALEAGDIAGIYEGSRNYDITLVHGTLTVTAKSVTVGLTGTSVWTYGDDITGLTASLNGVISDEVTATVTYSGESYNGVEHSGATVPTEAGIYTVSVTLSGDKAGNYVLSGDTAAEFIINRLAIDIPDAGSKAYTDEPLQSDLSDERYTVKQGDDWVDVNSYIVTLEMTDLNYMWKGADGNTVSVIFSITQAVNSVTAPTIDSWTYGESPSTPTGSVADFGSVHYEYAGEDSEYSLQIPSEAGKYTVIAVVMSDRNWGGAKSSPVEFEIYKAEYAEPTFDLTGWTYDADKKAYYAVYNGSEQHPTVNAEVGIDGIAAEVTYSKGVTNVSDGVISFTASFNTTSGNYDAPDDISVRIYLTAKPVDVVWTTEYVYNGSVQTPEAYYVGIDGSEVALNVAVDEFRNAGDYSASVMSPNANYVFTNGSETLKITPAPLTVTINDASSVYGEELSALTAEFAPLGTDTKEDIAKLFTLNVSAAEGDYNGAYLTAGRYDIVGGITETVTLNYNIVFENGVYTVTARTVIVAVADQFSDYDGTEPTIDQSQVIVEGLLPGDNLGITLVKAAGADAGSYVISCKWTNANYNVTCVPGVYKINPKSITAEITNTSWNYGDDENIGATAILDGVISGDTDSVTCVYTYTGTSADGSVTYDGTTVPVKAGSYIVTVTLGGEKAGNYSLTASAIVTVGKMAIAVPESAGEKVYNGSPQLSGYVPADGAGYTVTSDEGGTDVGTYDVVLTLTDPYNTAWEGSAASSVTIEFNITIADNTVTLTAAPGWIYGESPSDPTASATFGGESIYFLYSDSEGGEYTSVVPTAAGDYYVKAAVEGTDNWRYAESAPLKFTISARSDNTVTVTIDDWTYYGTPSVPAAEAAYGEVKYGYAAYDGTEPTEWSSEVPTAAGTYMIRAYVEATEDYNGCEATYTFEILPAALPAPVLNAYYGVYDGASHAALTSYSAKGVDGCEVTWQFALTAGEWQDEMPTLENAGSYTVWYSLSAANHEDRTGSFTVVITKRALVVRVGSETINFGESAPASFDLSYSGFADGDSAADSVSGTPVFSHNYTEGSGAGTYTVTVSGLQSVNYDITYINGTLNVVSASVVVTIYDQWSVYGDDIVLDQSAYGVSGLVEGETLDVVLTKADGTGAGTYAISGRAVSGNYDVTFIAGVYTIYPREVSVKIIDAGGGVYGGEIAPATARLDGALEQDDVRLNFTYSGVAYDGTVYNGDKVPEKAGVYTVTVTINENNYVMSGVCTSAFVVERRIVGLPDAGSKTYTGSALRSDLTSTEDYTVAQGSGWIDAGSYEVKLTLTDSDNCRFNGGEKNATVIFRITPAPNSVTAPTIEGWTYGDEPNAPYGSEALFGTPVYVYSESADGEFTSAVPTHAGVCYVKAVVSGSGNYAAAESEAVSFEVARRAVALPGLETSSSVYSGGEQSNAITGYDASVMALSSASSLVTDGSSASLKAAAAGEYTVTVTLTSSDYVWADGSDKVTLTWTIARLAVEKPTAAGGEYIYEGEPIEYIPEGFDETVMNIAGNVAEEAGEYTVTVTLKDAANYVWSDGTTDEVTFTFTVEERLSLLWLIILLACVVAAEVVMLIVGIVRSKKDGGDQGGDDPGASPTPGGAAHSAMLLCPALTAAVIPAQIAAVCILGGAFVVLLAAILVVFLKKKHKNGAPDPGDESGDGADNKPPLGEGADAAGEAAVSDAETESASDAFPEK